MIVNSTSCIYYPIHIVMGKVVCGTDLYIMIAIETLMLGEIIINFFKQDLDERGQSKFQSLEVVALRYFRAEFILDFIAFLPLGYLFTLWDERLMIFWFIKALRLRKLKYYLSNKCLIPPINKLIQMKQQRN